MNNPAQEIEQILAALALQPNQPDLYQRLGSAFASFGQWDRAREAFKRAAVLVKTPSESLRCNLAVAQMHCGNPDAADTLFRSVLADNPHSTPALFGLAPILSVKGKFEEAIDVLREVIRQQPNLGEAHQQLSFAQKFDSPDHPDIVRMQGALLSPNANVADQEAINFALGKALDDCREFDGAFTHFESANRLQKARLGGFDQNAYGRLIDHNIETFTAQQIERDKAQLSTSNRPIFIIGLPRSGTTLIEQILSSHQNVHGAGEIAYLSTIAMSALPHYPLGLQQLDAAALKQMGQAYLTQLETHSRKALHVTDKFTGNFQYVGLIAKLFPNATLINCARNPIDTCFSMFVQDFKSINRFSNDLDDLVAVYHQYERLMEHWNAAVANPSCTVHYEEIVTDPDTQVRRLLDACGLSWDERCLRFFENRRSVSTLSSRQVRQPLYTSSVNRWRNYQAHLGPLIAQFPPRRL